MRQRKRHHGDLGRRKGHLQRHKNAMVVAALRRGGGQIRGLEQFSDPVSQRWIARRRPGEPVGVLGKSRIIEDQRGVCRRACRKRRLFPVAADHQQRPRLLWKRLRQAGQKVARLLPCIRRTPAPIHEKTRAAAVGKEYGWLAPGSLVASYRAHHKVLQNERCRWMAAGILVQTTISSIRKSAKGCVHSTATCSNSEFPRDFHRGNVPFQAYTAANRGIAQLPLPTE